MTDTRIATIADSKYEVVVFTDKDGSAEAVITAPDSPNKPITIPIAKPPKGERIVTTRYSDGRIEITYRKV